MTPICPEGEEISWLLSPPSGTLVTQVLGKCHLQGSVPHDTEQQHRVSRESSGWAACTPPVRTVLLGLHAPPLFLCQMLFPVQVPWSARHLMF